jgi:type IV secretory pathway component VirB8
MRNSSNSRVFSFIAVIIVIVVVIIIPVTQRGGV